MITSIMKGPDKNVLKILIATIKYSLPLQKDQLISLKYLHLAYIQIFSIFFIGETY